MRKELKQRLCCILSVVLGIVCIGFKMPVEKVKPVDRIGKRRMK